MTEEVKTIVVEASDRYGDECLLDSMDKMKSGGRKPRGRVKIYEITDEGKKKLYDLNNLVVYLGREWLATRAFYVNNASISPTRDEWINWFGLGDGGATPGDPFDPFVPANDDSDMANEVPINASDTDCADFHDGAYYKHPLDSIVYFEDDANDNRWLVAQVTTTIGSDDANGELLSEAGLYTSESDMGTYAGPFHLFARITFPTISKDSDRQIVFVWYIYF